MTETARPGAQPGEEKAALLLRLRAVGVHAMPVLRAMEGVPRDTFLDASLARFAPLDIALPIGCGQTTAEPSFIARQLDALSCTPDSRVLEIGAGSGYVTALLARLASEVLGLERVRRLADRAEARLRALGLAQAAVDWADGLDGSRDGEEADRVLVHVALSAPPASLLDRLPAGGVLVCPLSADGRQDLVRFSRGIQGSITAVRLSSARLQSATAGLSRAL